MQPSQLAECQHILQAVIDSRENRRGLAGIFMALPDKKTFPDYYEAIPEPICLNMITDRLKKKNYYKQPEDFLRDLDLVFLNAQYYNQEKSGIHKDAVLLERLIFYIYRQLVAKGTLPEVTDEALLKHMNPPRTKGRPLKNPLIDNYKKDHPEIAALEPPKKPKPSKVAGSSSMTTLSTSHSADDKVGVKQPSTTPGNVPSVLASSGQTAYQQNKDGLHPSATTPDHKQATSPNSVPTPQKTSHATGLARLTAPPPPTTFPQVVIPAKIPGLDNQEFDVIAQHAKIREELDKVLEKWPGPAENIPLDPKDEGNKIPGSGWWGDEYNGVVANWQQMALDIVDKIRAYVDTDGSRPCGALEQVAVQSTIPYLSYRHPLSLQIIANNVISGVYPSMKAFDMEMSRLFEKARRYYQRVTPPYGAILAIQRLYNALTSVHESREIPQGGAPPSPVAYASFPAGPGNAKPMNDNGHRNNEAREFTSFRVATKDRVFTNMAKYKGMTYKIGDYVHIINPEDPSRPIPAQVYRSFMPTNQTQRHMVTVCWYFRPEQTVHLPTHLFYDDEVFKTGHMVDHPVEDIIERIGCQFYTKYIRGRPLKGEWYPGWPLYLCAARYNEKERLTVRIKNWGSCIPEELRKSDFMQVATFEKAPHILLLHKSPFLQGTLPGTRGITGFLSDVVGQAANEKKGPQDDPLTGDEEGGHDSGTPIAASERAAKKQRIGDKSPLGTAAALPHLTSTGLPSLTGSSPTAKPQMAISADPAHAQSQSGIVPVYSQGAFQQTPGGHLSGFTASPASRIPPQAQQLAQQSPFGGPHQIVPLNRSNPGPYGPSQGSQPLHRMPNQQPARQLDPSAPVPGQSRPLVYPPAAGFSLNTQPIRPISSTQHQYNYPSSNPGQGRPQASMHNQPHGALHPQQQADGRNQPYATAINQTRGSDRTIANLYGSTQELNRLCETEALPESTVNMLDRDPVTNRVLWFSGPPIDINVPEKPKHSATYLAYLARKRLQYSLGEDENATGQAVADRVQG